MACSPKTKSILTYNALCFCPAVFLLSVVFTNAWLENGENGVGLLGIGQPLYRDFKWRGLPEYSYHKRKFTFYKLSNIFKSLTSRKYLLFVSVMRMTPLRNAYCFILSLLCVLRTVLFGLSSYIKKIKNYSLWHRQAQSF